MAVVRRPCVLSALWKQFASPCSVSAVSLRSDKSSPSFQILHVTRGYSSYRTSPLVENCTDSYKYEVIKNPAEWKYVDRLLPFEMIPKLTPKNSYPSGFIPPREEALNLPYFIPRTKNHQLPIYLNLSMRGSRRLSEIRKIEGDIWLMNDEIQALLKQKHGRFIATKVHEFVRSIEVKGDFVLHLKEWAYSKGF